MGAGGGREKLKREGTYVYRWLIHIVVQQKPTRHCKAIILQWKKQIKKKIDGLASEVWKPSLDVTQQKVSGHVSVMLCIRWCHIKE